MSHAKQLHNRRYLNDYLEIINREGLPGNVKNDVCRKVQATVIATVQHVIEAALDEELRAYLGVDRYEHVPWGRPPATRSGSYQRTLLTQYGAIADLHVPKLRRGNGALTWQSIMRYECCWGSLLDHQVMSYCLGHSLRDLQETLALTLGELLSLAACNRMVSRVTEQLAVFKMQALESPPPVLLVDGMWVKIAYPTGDYRHDAQGRRRSVKRKQKRVVLSALGVWPDGHWEIVPWKVAEGERADTGQRSLANATSRASQRPLRLWWSATAPTAWRVLWIIISMAWPTNAVSSIRSNSWLTIWCVESCRWSPVATLPKRLARPSGNGKKPS